jgi:hypothetical protein
LTIFSIYLLEQAETTIVDEITVHIETAPVSFGQVLLHSRLDQTFACGLQPCLLQSSRGSLQKSVF